MHRRVCRDVGIGVRIGLHTRCDGCDTHAARLGCCGCLVSAGRSAGTVTDMRFDRFAVAHVRSRLHRIHRCYRRLCRRCLRHRRRRRHPLRRHHRHPAAVSAVSAASAAVTVASVITLAATAIAAFTISADAVPLRCSFLCRLRLPLSANWSILPRFYFDLVRRMKPTMLRSWTCFGLCVSIISRLSSPATT